MAWSKASLKKDPPAVDSDARSKLLGAVAEARDLATAAAGARAELNQQLQSEAVALKALETPIETAIAQIVSETAVALLDDLREAVQTAIAKQQRVKGAVTMVFAMGNAVGEPEINREAEMLDATLKAATAPEVPDTSAWPEFVKALRVDASAQLGG